MQELFINNSKADIREEEKISLNFSISDIKNPEKRKASFTKTITLPGTKANNDIFTQIYEVSRVINNDDESVNFAPDYNPNLKATAILYNDSIVQFQGSLRLLKVNVINRIIESYEVTLLGEVVDLFTEIGEDELTDLDFSEYDHTFNFANQKNSWDTKIQKDGGDYTNFSGAITPSFPNGQPTGEGYVYPLIDYGYIQSETTFLIRRQYPAIYLKEYFDKIFTKYGFTYTSNFIDSDVFKKLVIPYKGDGQSISASQITARQFSVDYSSTQSFSLGGFASQTLIFNNTVSDPSGVYNTSTGIYNVLAFGRYNLTANITFDYTSTKLSTDTTIAISRITDTGSITNLATLPLGTPALSDTGVTTSISVSNVLLAKNYKLFVRVFTTDSFLDPDTIDIDVTAGTFVNQSLSTQTLEGNLMEVNTVIPKDIKIKELIGSLTTMFNLYFDVDKDDPKNIRIEPVKEFYKKVITSGELITNGDFTTDLTGWTSTATAGSSLVWAWDSGAACVVTTDNIELTEALVQDVALIEDVEYTVSFDIVNTGGATVIPSFILNVGETNEETVHTEPLFSISKTITFTFTAPYSAVNIGIQIDHNSDDEEGEDICLDNVSITGSTLSPTSIDWTKKIDHSQRVQIEPVSKIKGKDYVWTYKEDEDFYNTTYQNKWSEIYGQYTEEVNNDFVKGEKKYEVIFSPTPSVGVIGSNLAIPRIFEVDSTGLVQPKEHNIRILTYGGVKSIGGNITFQSDIGDGGIQTTYPFASHLDDPETPTFDLCFGIPREIYFGSGTGIGANYTNNNLFNRYYSRFIEEIVSKDSRILRYKARLNLLDIYDLDFRELIYIENTLFRLNEIKSYDPKTGMCTIELLKVINKDPFVYFPEGVEEVQNQPTNFGIVEGGLNEVFTNTPNDTIYVLDGGEDGATNVLGTNGIIEGGIDG